MAVSMSLGEASAKPQDVPVCGSGWWQDPCGLAPEVGFGESTMREHHCQLP